MTNAEQEQIQAAVRKDWEAPRLETLEVASTESGPDPKAAENANFYVG